MKTLIYTISLLSLCFLFTGCPYESNIPIDKPSVRINPKLLGTWKSLEKPEAVCVVSKHDEFTYKLEINKVSQYFPYESLINRILTPEGVRAQYNKSKIYLAHISLINGASFLNIRKIQSGSDSLKYYFCKIEIKSDGIVLISEVSSDITDQFTDEKSLKKFIAANMNHSYFYNREDLTLINAGQIIELSKDRLKNEIELERSRTVNSIIIAVLIVVLLISFILWFYFSNKRKTEKLVFEKKEFSAMLHGQDTERRRIAADLHDRLGSMLSTVKIYFTTLEESIGELKGENKEQYIKANLLLDDACEEVRRISHDLASDVLVRNGLLSALNFLKENVSKINKVNMSVLAFGLEERFESIIEVALYHILQEMINNILKHSQATEVIVQLNYYEKKLNIVVEDNGVGFDVNEAKEKKGMGLKNIESRVRKLNGRLSIDSGKGSGTTMILDIPL